MNRTLRTLLVVAVIAGVAVSTVAAANAAGLRVIGSARSSGDFAVAAANGSKNHARVIYLRGYGRDLSGMGVVACSRASRRSARSRPTSRTCARAVSTDCGCRSVATAR
jgi:hypothetical protein